jgi:GNAT superfamily N-acetyltransferase
LTAVPELDGLIVRDATEHALAAILALTRADSFRQGDRDDELTANERSAFAEIDADPNQQLLVATLDDRVVATAHVTWIRTLSADGGLYCHVEGVRTASDLRGRGVGAHLMTTIEDEARRRGATRIQLTSDRRRDDAHCFYERLGYEPSHVGMKKYLT